MPNRYMDLPGQEPISETYQNIEAGFDAVQEDVDAAVGVSEGIQAEVTEHKDSTAAHAAEHITYSGTVAGVTNLKDAVDNVQEQFNTVVVSGDSSPAADQARISSTGTTYPTLKSRLDTERDGLAAQLAETAQKANWVDLNAFATGDGETDDLIMIHAAIEYARINGYPIYNFDKDRVYAVSAPVYIDSDVTIDLGGARIKKTTNTVGTGSNLARNGTITDSYAVDAFIIIRHLDNEDTANVNLTNIRFTRSAPNKIAMGIYAPRLSRSGLANIYCETGTVDYGVYGYRWFLIPMLDNIRTSESIATFRIANDGSNAGGSTSITSNQLINSVSETCLDLYGVSYSVFNIPLIDDCNGVAIKLAVCRSITINSPSVENLNSGRFITLDNTYAAINTPSVLNITGKTAETHLVSITAAARVVINGGFFSDFTGGTPASSNFPLIVAGGSQATVNNVRFPTNGNNFRSLTGGATLLENDASGFTYKESVGSTEISGKRRNRKIAYAGSQPADGTWAVGDIVYRSAPSNGLNIGWVCVAAGTPGTWVAFGQVGVMLSISSTPTFMGQKAVVAGVGYEATGTASAADWKQTTN